MDWGQGYVTDIGYVEHFSRQMSPTWLESICKLQNVALSLRSPVYLELGSGQGFGLNLLAASNPHSRFIGVDFNPSHIVNSRRLAAEAGLTNVEFIESSFEALAANTTTLPDCDIIVSHGVYTWIGPTQQESLKTIVLNNLKPGGIFYVSYNCMIGWGQISGIQKIFRDFHTAYGGPSRNAPETLKRLRNLRDSGFAYFSNNKALSEKLDELMKSDIAYLAHEYLNGHWQPMYAQDMLASMADCKLSFIGSARPGENIGIYSLKDEVREIVDSETHQGLRECMKDMALNTTFRQDVYVRGPISDPSHIWHERLKELTLTLTKSHHDVQMVANIPRGQLNMGNPVYTQALDLLRVKNVKLGDLSTDMTFARNTATVFMHTGWVEPASAPDQDATAAKRFNAAIARRSAGQLPGKFYASTKIGSGLHLSEQDSRIIAAFILDPDSTCQQIAEQENRLEQPQSVSISAEPNSGTPALTADLVESKYERWRSLDVL